MKKRLFFWGLILFLGCILFGEWAKVTHALTTEEEKKMGQRILYEMERKGEFVRDLLLQDFVDRVGRSLVAQVPSTPFEYRFLIVQSTDANAYAIPGGYVFVTTGLLVLADNEQEVAGVLSHEIAHVQRRHVAQMIERSKTINLASLAAMLAGIFVGGGRGGEAIAMGSMAAA
jgi:predicted Zn-dependent protease